MVIAHKSEAESASQQVHKQNLHLQLHLKLHINIFLWPPSPSPSLSRFCTSSLFPRWSLSVSLHQASYIILLVPYIYFSLLVMVLLVLAHEQQSLSH